MYTIRPRNLFGKKLKKWYRLLNDTPYDLPRNWSVRPSVMVNQHQLNAFMDRLMRERRKLDDQRI